LRISALPFSSNYHKQVLAMTIYESSEISHGIGQQTRAEAKALTENHLGLVRQRMADFKNIETALSQISQQCDGANESADHCPILLSLFGQS
jgi:hypothetical protein